MNMKAVLELFNALFTHVITAINERQKLTIYQNVLRKASCAGSPFLKYFFGRSINRVMILLLQLISLFTTLAGANYYLRGISPSAPLLFAVAIQLGVFYYANSYVDMTSKKYSHTFLLALLTSISIIFSYTGLAVVSCPPEYEYARAYKNYEKQADAMKNALLTANSTQQDVEQALISFYGNLNTTLSTADAQIIALNEAISTDQSIIDSNRRGTSIKSYNPYTGESTTTVTMSDAGVAASQDLASKTQKKSNIESARQALDTAIQEVSQDTLNRYVKDELLSTDRSNAARDIVNLIGNYNSLNQILGTNLHIDADYINELSEQYKTSGILSNITLPSYTDYLPDPVDDSSLLYSLIHKLLTQDSSAEAARNTLTHMKTAIDANYAELSAYASLLHIDGNPLDALTEIKAEINQFGDPNVQVIHYLVEAQYRDKVLGCLFLAILVDGLTLLLGILGNKKSLSLLDPATNKELIDNEDELFAIIFVSLVGTKVPKVLENNDLSHFKAACITYVNSIRDLIGQFLSHFRNSPWTGQWGYGLYAEYSELTKISGSVSIISILNQLGYLQFLSKEDFQLLQKNFDGIDISTNSNVAPPERDVHIDNYICILRYRVEMYLHSNIAEISTMFINNTFSKET